MNLITLLFLEILFLSVGFIFGGLSRIICMALCTMNKED